MLLKGSIHPPRITISKSAKQTIESYVQTNGKHEAGGVLIGTVYPSVNEIKIEHVTTPSANDKRGRFFFVRDAATTSRLVADYWEKSEGTQHYVGEWHTHPQRTPTPSITDKVTMRRLLKSSALVTQGLVLIILGTESCWTGYWEGDGYCQIDIET